MAKDLCLSIGTNKVSVSRVMLFASSLRRGKVRGVRRFRLSFGIQSRRSFSLIFRDSVVGIISWGSHSTGVFYGWGGEALVATVVKIY